MQGFFEKKQMADEEAKRLNIGTERGINMHLHTGAKFKDGMLNITKQGIKAIESGEMNPKKLM